MCQWPSRHRAALTLFRLAPDILRRLARTAAFSVCCICAAAMPSDGFRHIAFLAAAGRLADPSLPAELRHGRTLTFQLQDERLLRLRKARCYHAISLRS